MGFRPIFVAQFKACIMIGALPIFAHLGSSLFCPGRSPVSPPSGFDGAAGCPERTSSEGGSVGMGETSYPRG